MHTHVSTCEGECMCVITCAGGVIHVGGGAETKKRERGLYYRSIWKQCTPYMKLLTVIIQ